MAILKKNAFSRRVPDLVTEELVAVLSRRASFEFKQLFDIVHENLRARNAASGGEEMLRLRAYEKLQNLVARGAVRKTGKQYKVQPRFSVKFYLVAMLFILFDLEIVFMYPWAVVYKEMIAESKVVLWSMLSFISILMVGYVYALKKGALDWKK